MARHSRLPAHDAVVHARDVRAGRHKPEQPDPTKTSAGSDGAENPEVEIRELKARLARLEDHQPETGS